MVILPADDRGDSCVMVVVIALYCWRRLKACRSGCPGLHVVQHGLKAIHVWGVSVGQIVRQATVQAERL